jgi:hypothetical protein
VLAGEVGNIARFGPTTSKRFRAWFSATTGSTGREEFHKSHVLRQISCLSSAFQSRDWRKSRQLSRIHKYLRNPQGQEFIAATRLNDRRRYPGSNYLHAPPDGFPWEWEATPSAIKPRPIALTPGFVRIVRAENIHRSNLLCAAKGPEI